MTGEGGKKCTGEGRGREIISFIFHRCKCCVQAWCICCPLRWWLVLTHPNVEAVIFKWWYLCV